MRFKRFMSARELHVFYTPQPDEIVWAREAAGSDGHLLALVVLLKAFNRLGYFPVLDEVPAEVVGHIRRICGCRSMSPRCTPRPRTAGRHRSLVRARSEAVHDRAGARKVAADAIEEAARRKNDPAGPSRHPQNAGWQRWCGACTHWYPTRTDKEAM